MAERKRIKVCCIVSVDITLKFMLINQLEYLYRQGYEVHAISSPGRWIKDIEKKGIKMKTIEITRKMFTPISDFLAFIKMYFYFKKEKFDIVHVHTLKPEFYGQIAAKLAGAPIIINTIHGLDFGEYTPYWEKKIIIFLQKIAAKFSDVVLSVSHNVIDEVVRRNICKPEILRYLGRDIDTNRFNPNRFSKDFVKNKKTELGIGNNKKVVGIVARLVEEKGYLDLFQAFQKVVSRFSNAILLVIGQEELQKRDGIKKDIVKDYNIQDRVLFLGERTDVEELYPVMDVFVLPTHREGIGAAILEASAMERPVITTKVGGCVEAIDDGKTGILVPLEDIDKLSEVIIYILSNPDKAIKMGKAGRKKIIREFRKEIVLERLGKYYNELIKEKLRPTA